MTAELVEWCQRDTVLRHVRRAAMLIAVGRDLQAAPRKWRMANLSSVDRSAGAIREQRLQSSRVVLRPSLFSVEGDDADRIVVFVRKEDPE